MEKGMRYVVDKFYVYGMRLRGFSIGCQPMQGFVKRLDDELGDYYDLLVYDRRLNEKELNDYELDFLREVKSV